MSYQVTHTDMVGDEMAESEKSNIKQEYTGASLGLNMDQVASQIRKGSLSYAHNAVIENFDDSGVNYQNEPGNELCITFPEGFALIGTHYIAEQSKHIFFITNNSTGDSQIGYMDNNDCFYHTLVNASCLNFSIHHPIHKVVHRITNCSTEIYWTDGYNPRRYLDINNIPFILTSGTPNCNAVYSTEIDCNQLRIQPNFSVPLIDVSDITSGGNLLAGAYQFAVQYSDAAGNPFTSYYSITNPTPIADVQIATVNFNYPVGKSIVIDITNLDITGLYEYFNVAVVKTVNAISSVELVGTYFIEGTTKQITYTGQNATNIRLSMDDIFERYPYYDIADDVTTAQDTLIWTNLSSIDRMNYQQIANKIELEWETWRIPSTENYADELNATNLRGYLRDEVYAFEIAFILAGGKETDGFHIPGRERNFNENVHPDVPDTNEDFVGEPTYYSGDVGMSPYWKIYNTATVTGYSPEYTSDSAYKGPYQYGEMAYWESTEEYPCNTNVWGDLAGQKIRHHKFPDVAISPIFESYEFTDRATMVMGSNAIFPIGIKINPQLVQSAINSSSLTTEQKNDIVGFKILRGDRNVNKSIVAKGMLRNVNSYERDGKSFFYPNYPYNDLHSDPFLNVTNNAYLSECESFTIEITELHYSPSKGKDCAEVQYTDCNINRSKNVVYDAIGTYSLCSTSKPVIIVGEGTVTYDNYDLYKLGRVGIGYWVAQYEDITYGIVSDRFINGPSSHDIQVKVVVGTEPTCIDVCPDEDDIIIKEFLGTYITNTSCIISEPIPPATDKYRQIFNSPETSFGQPFLGDILKLESVIFGKGKAHFKEVEKNAKYKLISKEAQQEALDSSAALGGYTHDFDVSAMFAAYQAYLEIYINGITSRNYAYSFNSIASYNYCVAVPNDEGIKQRNIDSTNYLIPAVVSVDGDDINNYQRESSVYVKTEEEFPFPSDSYEMLPLHLDEQSRFTISEKSNCNNPEKQEDIEVVSYYASMKKDIVNQWGQIYSYETIDTGFTYIFDQSTATTVFGGDIYICKFAYKTKLPFFIDNRVGAPDGSDIFYDEIGNVAFPKYWHSSRSILDDYAVPPGNSDNSPGILVNFISYKAHYLDCPNDNTIIYPTVSSTTTMTGAHGIVSDGNSEITYYDGFFYLFSYGIPSFYCESSYNIDLRQAFNNREGDYWPHVTTSIPDNWVQESFVSIANDNTYYYNTSLIKQNKESFHSHLPADWDDRICLKSYPFRAIYSDPQNVDSDNRVNTWRVYRATSYYDFPQNFGNITSLDGVQNRAILARFENKTLLYGNLLTIDTSNPQAAYLGNPVLFKGAPPIDFADTDLGYVGSQHKLLLKIPQGQISIDAKRGQVFLIQGTQVTDISSFGTGMNRFFTEHLNFEILKKFPNANIDNHFNGLGLHAVYDSKLDRVIITKLDYITSDAGVIYDEETDEYYVLDEFSNRTIVYFDNTYYFANRSWTISFNMNTKSWISFHGYLPNWYIAENNFFYSGINSCCDDFEFIAGELASDFYTTTTTSTTCEDCTTTTTTTCEGCTTTTTSSTTTSTSSTTTTTTTLSCDMEGYYEEYTATTSTTSTSTTICVRPRGMEVYYLIWGYVIDDIEFDSTTDAETACAVLHWLVELPEIEPLFLAVEGFGIYEGSRLYLSDGTTDCECNIPDGWYFSNETVYDEYVFYVENCVITELYICPRYTTTTTTTLYPPTTTTTTSSSSTTTTSTTVEPTTTTTTTLEPTTTTTTEEPTTTTTTTCEDCTTTTTTTCEGCTTTTTTSSTSTTTTSTTLPPTTTTTTSSSTTTTTTTKYLCAMEGYYEFYTTTTSTSSTTTTSTTLPPTTTTTTSSSTTTTTTSTSTSSTTTTSTTLYPPTTTTTTTGVCYLAAHFVEVDCADVTTTTTTCGVYVTVPTCEELTTTTSSSTTTSTSTSTTTSTSSTTTTSTTLPPLVECLNELKIEFIYIEDETSDEILINTYSPGYVYPGFLDQHTCDYAVFDLYVNDIFLGDASLNNNYGGECKNPEGRPETARYCLCHDYTNRPDELVVSSGKTWKELGGNDWARYDKIVLTTEQAMQIGAISDGDTWVTFSIYNANGWYDMPCLADTQPGHHALNNVYCWVRVSNAQGEVLYNGYPTGPFVTVNVCPGYVPPTTTTSTTCIICPTTTTSTTAYVCNLNYTIDSVTF